jgi:hypothetical protein
MIPTDALGNVDFVCADADGRIDHTGNAPRYIFEAHQREVGRRYIEGRGSIEGHYVTADDQVVARQSNPSSLDGMKISNVPNPSTVTIGTELPVDIQDGEIDLEFAYPGTYLVVIESWPYLAAKFEVTQP